MVIKEQALKLLKSAISSRKFVPITMGVLITVSSFIPSRVHAVSGETLRLFQQTSNQIVLIMQKSKRTDEKGNVAYDVSKENQISINNILDRAMGSLEKDVKDDIKNQNWGQCQMHLEILARLAHDLGQNTYEKRIMDLWQTAHSDLGNHVDGNIEGLFTLKNSGKVYAIGKGASRDISLARSKAELNARGQVIKYLGLNQARLTLTRPLFYQYNQDGTWSVVMEIQGDATKQDGTKLTAKELAQQLEREGRFLPLK